jgi:hypothetical protein
MVLAIAEILGTVGAFGLGAMVVVCAMTGLVVGVWALRGTTPTGGAGAAPPSTDDAPKEIRDRTRDRIASVVAVLMVAALLAQWTPATVTALTQGMGDTDTITQHMPFAARFIQEGSTTELPALVPDFLNTFHPANSELLHSVGILPFGRDFLSPVFNIGWMLLTLFAAWCVGRRYTRGILSLIAIAVVLTAPIAAATQAGAAKNDVTSVFFILAAIALVAHARWERPTVLVAGLAAGLAVGTRLTSLAPVAALTVGVVVASPRGRRTEIALAWLGAVVVAGGYWYGRNFVRAGNPIPPAHVGFLPSPRIPVIDRYGFSVGHYLTRADVWRSYFIPGFQRAFGPAWFLVFALAGVGAVSSALPRRNAIVRVAGVVAVVAAAAYVFMPTGAIGREGEPILFMLAIRYALPAIGTGFVLLPLLPGFRQGSRSLFFVILMAFFFLTMQTVSGPLPSWPGLYRAAAAFVGIGVAAAAAASAFVRTRLSRRSATAVLALVALAAIAGGWKLQDRYLRDRYTSDASERAPAYAWARNVHDADIAFAGFFQSYPLFGLDLSNRVQFVGRKTPHGGFTTTRSCEEFRRTLREGQHDYLVVAPAFEGSPEPREAAWARGDPAVKEILHDGPTTVFRLTGPADPSGCD